MRLTLRGRSDRAPDKIRGTGRATGGFRGNHRPPGQQGSMAVEFVVAVPGFLVLMLLVAAGGDWVSSSGQVGAAASDAARAASLARTGNDANTAASDAANYDLKGACTGGAPVTKVTPLPLGTASFATAQDVQVTVQCTVNLQAFKVIGFPVTTTFTRIAVAPLDPFVQRSA
jgi:Flp pilus assembly protein TadG